jgi:hypothetical protein
VPFLVGALAGSAVLNLWGAKKGADASKDAAAQQVASADQAKAELRPIYEGNVARMDPYAQLGGQAVGQLRNLSGFGAPPALPPGGSAGIPQVAVPLNPNGNQGTVNPPMNMSDPRVQMLAKGGSLADIGGTAATGGGQSSYGSMSPQQMGQVAGGMQQALVKMRAPDGEERDVPEAMAARFEQAGAMRI